MGILFKESGTWSTHEIVAFIELLKVCCFLAAGSEIFSPTPYFTFLGFLSLTTKSAADKIQYSLWKDSWALLQLYCFLWLLWRCCKWRNRVKILKITKTKSKVAIWNEKPLDSFPNAFQCFHLPSTVSHSAEAVRFFRIKRMVSIISWELVSVHERWKEFTRTTRISSTTLQSKNCRKHPSRGFPTSGSSALFKKNIQCDEIRPILTL